MKNKKNRSLLRRSNAVAMTGAFLLYSFAPIITFGMGIGAIDEGQIGQDNGGVQIEKSNEEKIQDFQKNQNDISIPFIANFGQIDEKVKFYADFFSGTFFISEEELTYLFVKGGEEKRLGGSNREFEEEKQLEAFSLKEKFLDKEGNQINYIPTRGTRSDKNVSFFKGDENQWKSSVDVYDYISLGEVWENIEVVAQAKKDNVEKLFHVQPNGNPEEILMFLEGANRLSIDEGGELVIETKAGKFSMTKPVAFQFIDGKKVEVQVSYDIKSENKYAFSLGEYDKTKALTIDPLIGGTYIGGADGDFRLNAQDLTFDNSGNVYLAGYTSSSVYPTTAGVIYPTYAAGDDGFVSILNSDLTSLIASTYIGGSASDRIYNIRVNGSDVIISGLTKSSTFPRTAGAYDTTFAGTGTTYNIFITKLNSTLTAIQASTFFGVGTVSYEYVNAMEIDSNGKIFLSGYTSSSAFPTTAGAYDTTFGGGRDIYVSRLNPSLAASPSCLEASTYIGGTGSDYGYEMKLDSVDNVVVAGETYSSNFPVTGGAYQTTLGAMGGGITVSKLNNDLTSLTASTFLGGLNANSYDEIYGMDLDSLGNVFIGGTSYEGYFPTTVGAYRETFNATGYNDLFIAKLSSDLTSLSGSTYFGGLTSEDYGGDVSIDSNNKVFITGYLYPYDDEASDVPTTEGAYQTTAPGNDWYTQTVVSRFSSDLTILEASSLINGDDDEEGIFVRIKPNNDVVVFMETGSANMPLGTGAYSSTVGTGNGYIITLDNDLSAPLGAPDHLKITGSATQVAGETQQITITANDESDNPQILYTGDKSITLSGPAVAPDGTIPTCTDKNGSDVAIGTATTVTFNSGVATCNLKLYKAESVSIDIAEGVYSSAADETYDLDIVVNPAAVNADNSILDVSADPAVVLQEEVVTVTTKDAYENLLQEGDEDVGISISGINTDSLNVTDNNNGTYTATYTPSCDLGVDAITGTINGDAIGGDGDGTSDGTYNITTQIKILVTINDLTGSQVSYGGDEVALNITGANTVTPSVIDNGDGTYSAYYTPTSAGTDQVSGTLNGRAIGSDSDGTDNGIYQFEVCEGLVAYNHDQSSDLKHLAKREESKIFSQKIEEKFAQISGFLVPSALAEDKENKEAQPELPEIVKQENNAIGELDFEKIDNVSIPFVENEGVIDDSGVKYFSSLNSGRFYVTEDALNYSIFERLESSDVQKNDQKTIGMFFEERFSDGNGGYISFSPEGKDQAEAKNNFFKGNDRTNWKTDLKSYKKISLGEIWDKIEVDLFSYSQKVEKVFSVAPEGDVDDISLKFEGINSFSLNEERELLLVKNEEEIKFSKPIAYQELENGERKVIEVNYRIKKDGSYGFNVGPYDKTKTLVIDPWLGGTYLGGSSDEAQLDPHDSDGRKLVEDSNGNIFVAASTDSSNFPTTTGVYDETKDSADSSIVISKFNSELTELLASTIIEGTGGYIGSLINAIDVDSSDNIFMLTTTWDTDFPLTSGAYDSVDDNNGGASFVVSKFSNDLSTLEASTVVQGTKEERGHDLEFDSSDNVYVFGWTQGEVVHEAGEWGYMHSYFPITPGAWIPEFFMEGEAESMTMGWDQEVVVKLNNDLSQLLASTYLPAVNVFSKKAFMVASNGNVVVGSRHSSFGGYDNSYYYTDGTFDHDSTISKGTIAILDPNLTTLVAGSFFGGDTNYSGGTGNVTTNITDFAEDSSGNIYVVGSTLSADFPTTPGAFDETYNGDSVSEFNGCIAKVSGDLTQLLAATYYGYNGSNHIYSIDLDSNSNVFITGYSGSSATMPAPVGSFSGQSSGAFISRFSSDLTSLDASGFVGVKGDSILVSSTDEVYVTGILYGNSAVLSSNAVGFYDPTTNGWDDMFLIKLDNYLSNDSNPQESSIDVSACTPTGDVDPPVDDGNDNPTNPTIPQDNPSTIEKEDEEATNYIHLTDSKDDKLTFEVKIDKDTKVKSDPIDKDEDESTSVKNITLKTEEDEDVEGKFIIDSKEKSTDIISSEENGTCTPYEIINVTTDFSDKNIKEAEVTFRIPAGWLKKYDFDKLIFVKGEKEDFSPSDKMLTKNKWTVLLSTLVSSNEKEYIYKAEADSLGGWWGIYACSANESSGEVKEGGNKENNSAITPIEETSQEPQKVEEDIDNDGKNEEAINEDENTQNGYETFNDPDDSSELIVSPDGDNDGKDDFFVSVDENNEPEVYWDPDSGIVSEVEILDIDEDGNSEYLFDADQDGQNDHYYDPDDKLVKGISVEKNISLRDSIQNLIARFKSILNPMILGSVFLPLLAMLIQTGGARESMLLLREGYFRLFGILLWRKKKRYDWGVVYDIKTGQPIRLAAVSVIDKKTGRAKETVTTDKYGSYCFLVTPGSYTLRVSKKGFKTPNKNNSNNWNTFYQNSYFGEELQFQSPDKIAFDLPLEKIEAKSNLSHFYPFFVHVFSFIFWVGLIFDLIICVFYPQLFNFVVLAIYIYVAFLKDIAWSKVRWGLVNDLRGVIQPFAVIKLFYQSNQSLVTRTIADEEGRYFLVANKGNYFLQANTVGEQARIGNQRISILKRDSIKERITI